MSLSISQGNVGTICHSQDERYERFDWKVEKIFSLSTVPGHYYESPNFDFAETSWCLRLFPNGETMELEGWISLFISLIGPNVLKPVHYTIGIVNSKGNLEEWWTSCRTFDKHLNCETWGLKKAKTRSELLGRKIELTTLECLTITCIMSTTVPRLFRDTVDASVQTDVESKEAKIINEGSQSWKKEDTVDASVQTDVESKEAKIMNEGSQSWKKEGVEKVVEDMGKLLVSGDNSDVTVQVGDEQFNVHKNILAARTPVLAAMFRHETAEKISNKISISDCEPDIFKEFLHYIYTGTVQDLTVQNVFPLYQVADKYLVDDLKLRCSIYIQDMLCVETFCNTVELALRYGEAELLQQAITFASKNMPLILPSLKWQNFIQEYPLKANEILIKCYGLPRT